jgi:hypothetical protein
MEIMNVDKTLQNLPVLAPLVIEHPDRLERGTLAYYTATGRIVVTGENGHRYSFGVSGFLIGEKWAKTWVRLPKPTDEEYFERAALKARLWKVRTNLNHIPIAQLRAIVAIYEDFAGYQAKEARYLELETLVGTQAEQIDELESIIAEQDHKLENEIPYD